MCHIYSYVYIYIPVFFYTVCLRLQTLEIVISFLCTIYFSYLPQVPLGSCDLCIFFFVYNCIYYTSVRGTFPIVCIGSKTTMCPCVLTLTMYVHYVLFVPNKPLYVDVFLIPTLYFIHCCAIIFNRSDLSTYLIHSKCAPQIIRSKRRKLDTFLPTRRNNRPRNNCMNVFLFVFSIIFADLNMVFVIETRGNKRSSFFFHYEL